MQDWEWEVSDHTRIGEFLAVYESEGISDDERFSLMEMIIQSYEDLALLGGDLSSDARWQHVLALLERRIPLHAHSVWYWSCSGKECEDDLFCVSPFIHQILAAHWEHFSERPTSPNAGPAANSPSPT
jgi:hypothetical protein